MARGHVSDIEPVRLEILDPEVDPDLLRVDAVEAHRGDPGDPFEGADDLAFEEIVALGEIALRRQAALRGSASPPRRRSNLPPMRMSPMVSGRSRRIRSMRSMTSARARLISWPQANLSRTRPPSASHVDHILLDALDRAQYLFERPDDEPLGLLGGGVGEGNVDEEFRFVDLGHEAEGQPVEGDQAQDHGAGEDGQGGDGAADGELGKGHDPLSR